MLDGCKIQLSLQYLSCLHHLALKATSMHTSWIRNDQQARTENRKKESYT